MLQEFAKHMWLQERKIFDPIADRIRWVFICYFLQLFHTKVFDNRCLAHIINLATQAFIMMHSKSRHYNPADPDADLIGDNVGRDAVGLVRAICVRYQISLYLQSSSDSWILGTFLCKTEAAFCRNSNTQGSQACLPTATWHASSLVINICHNNMGWEDAWCTRYHGHIAATLLIFNSRLLMFLSMRSVGRKRTFWSMKKLMTWYSALWNGDK